MRVEQSLRLYDVAANKQLAKFEHKAPVLGIAFKSDGSAVYSGGLDTWVRQYVRALIPYAYEPSHFHTQVESRNRRIQSNRQT